jgi:hypothetical protein
MGKRFEANTPTLEIASCQQREGRRKGLVNGFSVEHPPVEVTRIFIRPLSSWCGEGKDALTRKFPFRTPPFAFDTPLARSVDPDGLDAVLKARLQHLLRGFRIDWPKSSTAFQND